MTTRLYYGALFYDSPEERNLTSRDLPPDGDFYSPHVVEGIRLTKEPNAWHRTLLVIAVDVPVNLETLARYRVRWDWEHESYDLPEGLVNSSRRVWVRDEETVLNLMRSNGENRLGEKESER